MKRLIVLFCALFLAIAFGQNENDLQDEDGLQASLDELEERITNIESAAAFADKVIQEGILPSEEADKYYDQMADTVEDIIEMIKVPTHAYEFVKAKGIDRIFIPNISVKYGKLRVSLLMLVKVLFELMPATDARIPVYAIDTLVDIFDTDPNLGIKAHVLDILSVWLVGNPKAQVRIIKMRGLEPFYRQIPKLSTPVTITLLDLLNNILEEHIKVRKDVGRKSKADSEKALLYQRMGLIERMSSRTFCQGLLNIFYATWSHTNTEVPMPVLKLIMNTMPYCAKPLKGHDKAVHLLTALRDHIGSATNYMYQGANLNLTDIKLTLEHYISEMKLEYLKKDEF